MRAIDMYGAREVRAENVPGAGQMESTGAVPEQPLGRRTFLRRGLIGGGGVMLSMHMRDLSRASALETGPVGATPTASRVLLAFFSRSGENYYYGGRIDLEVGNTEIVAGMISDRIDCDVYRIEASEPYSDDYDETVARNVREQDTDTRPAIANSLTAIEDYDIVLLGSPIWNVRAPMIMSTFVESFDFTGKTIYPFTTYAMSGLGTTERDYATSCPGSIIGEGLAVRGEEVNDAAPAVETWLQRIGLLNR